MFDDKIEDQRDLDALWEIVVSTGHNEIQKKAIDTMVTYGKSSVPYINGVITDNHVNEQIRTHAKDVISKIA